MKFNHVPITGTGHRHEEIEHDHDRGDVPHDHSRIDYVVLDESWDADGTRHIHKVKVLRWEPADYTQPLDT